MAGKRNLMARAWWSTRLVSPTGFLLVVLCFALPFLTVSCAGEDDGRRYRGSLSYTGADLVVGGRVDLYQETHDERGVQRVSETDLRRSPVSGEPIEPIPVQPFMVATMVLLGAGALAGFLRPSGLRRLTAGAVALVAAITLAGGALRARVQMAEQLVPLTDATMAKNRDMITFGSGFWLALALLLLLSVGNIVASLRVPAPGERRLPDESARPVP
jgi:hypothetical protein